MEEVSHKGKRIASNRDLISSLHDSLISNILSRLTAEDAVRMSIMSRFWRYKWTLINKVQINDISLMIRIGMDAVFVSFFEGVLRQSRHVTSFDLFLHGNYGPGRIRRWISDVVNREKIECLILHYFWEDGFVFPNILNCTELRELVLHWKCVLNFPATSSFPNLIDLYLDKVTIANENLDTDTMIINFPVLKSLTLEGCRWLNMKVVKINAPSLTTFSPGSRDYLGIDDHDYSIRIIGARLTKFNSSGGLLEDNVISNTSTIISATFCNSYNQVLDNRLLARSGTRAQRLMNGMLNIEDLKISGFMAKALMQSKRELPVCRYDKLRRLILCSYSTFKWSTEAVCNLLCAAPYLKFFTIDMIDWDEYDGDDTVMEPVPSCIMHQLEEVKFSYKAYKATHQLHIEKFLLEKGSQLRKCYISGYAGVPRNEIVMKLSATLPESSTCLISIATK